MSLAIALIALALAGWAVYAVHRTQAAVAALAESLEDEAEAEESELWIADGEFYVPDRQRLADLLPSAVALFCAEGVPSAVTDSGVWSLHKLLTEANKPPKPAKLEAVPR